MGRDQAKNVIQFLITSISYDSWFQLKTDIWLFDFGSLDTYSQLMRFGRFQNKVVFIFEPTAQMMLSIIQHLYFFCAFISLELFRQSQSLSITKHLFITIVP